MSSGLGLVLLACLAGLARAEEGGSGHYFPGSMASFVDGIPAEPTLIVRYNLLYYDGSYRSDVPLPVARLNAFDVDVESVANGLTLLWRPTWGSLGPTWSYAMSATIPYVAMDVSADVEVNRADGSRGRVGQSDAESGWGDAVLMPLMLNYRHGPDVNAGFRLGFYAPTGDYQVGRLANPGKNYWTMEPVVHVIYLGQKNGREASLFWGFDFNQENPDTDYRTGTQTHLDGTLAQHVPLGAGLAGIGLTGHWYQQIEGDSGEGANLGDFEGKTVGLGPSVSYVVTAGSVDLIAELKWVHEVDTERRPEGDLVWFKFVGKF